VENRRRFAAQASEKTSFKITNQAKEEKAGWVVV